MFGAAIVVSVAVGVIALATGAVRPDTIQTVVADGGPWSMVVYVVLVAVDSGACCVPGGHAVGDASVTA